MGTPADKPLPTLPEHSEWRPGGTACHFRASIVRKGYKWAVMVLCISADQERAFVRIESSTGAEVNGTQTCWVPVDDLQEG